MSSARRLDLDALVRADLVATAVFALVALAASVAPDQVRIPYAVLSMVLFALGTVAFLWAYAVAVARSAVDYVSTAGVFFLTGGVLTGSPRARLLGCLVAQPVIAIAAAAAHPYTAAAFGIMAPMFALGVAGLAGARFGTFEPRPDAAGEETADDAGDGGPDTTAQPGR